MVSLKTVNKIASCGKRKIIAGISASIVIAFISILTAVFGGYVGGVVLVSIIAALGFFIKWTNSYKEIVDDWTNAPYWWHYGFIFGLLSAGIYLMCKTYDGRKSTE